MTLYREDGSDTVFDIPRRRDEEQHVDQKVDGRFRCVMFINSSLIDM